MLYQLCSGWWEKMRKTSLAASSGITATQLFGGETVRTMFKDPYRLDINETLMCVDYSIVTN